MSAREAAASPSVPQAVDLVVVGSGAAGLAAALTAASAGLSVLVVEKTEFVGGTTAYSAGTSWVPGHRFLRESGTNNDVDAARLYLDALVGDKSDPEMRETYLTRGPEMIEQLERLGMRFRHSAKVVDYHPELPGAGIGRALEPEPFDARRLDRQAFARIRRPIPEFALFGGSLMIRRAEADQLLAIFRLSPKAALLALRLGVRWVLDVVRFGRGARLTMGNALVARLYSLVLDLGVTVAVDTPLRALIHEGGRVAGIVIASEGRERTVTASRGVILAGGGFAADDDHRARLLPAPAAQFSPAADGATGDTQDLALALGASMGDHRDNALWFPSSIGRRRDGSRVVFAHIWDRAKPGIIAVGPSGHRFVDESVSYHRFVRAMYDADVIPAWLVVDARKLRRYGLGMIRPFVPQAVIRRYVRDGYIRSAPTIAQLASAIGVDPAGLEESVLANNRASAAGIDEEFGKGASTFGRQYGDPHNTPNPNLGTIEKAPFYALAVLPAPLATASGLRIDTHARVVDAEGAPIAGLYACGNDADSVMAGEYPGAGCQVGAGLTFGYIAARQAAP